MTTQSGWQLEVDRGPNCLFIKVGEQHDLGDEGSLAESIWSILQQHFTNRVVLELDQVVLLQSMLISELLRLQKRVAGDGGMLRLCGLSEKNRKILESTRLADKFPNYRDRVEALHAARPMKPR